MIVVVSRVFLVDYANEDSREHVLNGLQVMSMESEGSGHSTKDITILDNPSATYKVEVITDDGKRRS